MKYYLLLTFRLGIVLAGYLLFCSFPGCSISDEHIQEEFKKFRQDCNLPDTECDGILGAGLFCGSTTFSDGTPCVRTKSMNDNFEINIVGFFSVKGKGSGTLSLTTKPRFAIHNHFVGEQGTQRCAPESIIAQYGYEEKGSFKSEGGVNIIQMANGQAVSDVSHVFASGARCVKAPHAAPLECHE